MHRMKYLFRAIALSVKLKSPLSLVVSCGSFLAAFIPMLISLQLAAFTDDVQALYHQTILLKSAIISFGILAFLYVLQTCFQLLQNYCVKEDVARIKRFVKEKVMNLMTEVPYKYIENYDDFCEKVDFVRSYAGEKTAGSISLVFNWIANVISFVGVISILSTVNIWIVVALIVTCIPAVILSVLQQDETYRARTKWLKEGRLTIHYSDICRMNEAMKEIRFWGLYPYIKNKWKELSKVYIAKKNAIIRKHVFYNSIADLLRNGIYVAVVMITAWEIYQNPAKGLGVFMLVITAAGQLQTITTNLLVNAISIFSDMKYMQDFFELLETEKEEVSVSDIGFDNVEIQFDHVEFSYPNSTHKALDGITVNIKQGEKIAIVGLNGSGKSTFVNLLCGFYKPDNGTVKINGMEISDNLAKVHQSMSAIFQNFCQYQDTLRNNISISQPDKECADSLIYQLAQTVGANEIIDGQEKHLDEMIGIFSDKGNNLSGGQWQKIAMTRALYRDKARVFILDEPTAALDPVSEANIYRNFARMTGDKTTLLISHRLGIASMVDRILVFENGKIVEDGDHEKLMKQNGLYAEMYRSQARWYLVDSNALCGNV